MCTPFLIEMSVYSEKKQRLTGYIEENLNRHITLAELADVAAMSKYHFARCFKLAFGKTPSQYIACRRVERAKVLLRGTSIPLSEVAYACGFASQSHMTTVFKRLAGATPGSYRSARVDA